MHLLRRCWKAGNSPVRVTGKEEDTPNVASDLQTIHTMGIGEACAIVHNGGEVGKVSATNVAGERVRIRPRLGAQNLTHR
jgi:hypothetical protein